MRACSTSLTSKLGRRGAEVRCFNTKYFTDIFVVWRDCTEPGINPRMRRCRGNGESLWLDAGSLSLHRVNTFSKR